MGRRLKVLISAYACEPNKGSEPEVGWQWALQMARFHEVTVITRADNRPVIEKELELLRGHRPLPSFVYFDLPGWVVRVKERLRAVGWYYSLWQRRARRLIRRLHRQHHFDLIHHVTFAGFRYPTAVWGHGVPCIWGPIGGMENIPLNLLPLDYPKAWLRGLARNFGNWSQSLPFNRLYFRARRSSLVLAATPETERCLKALKIPARLLPAVGISGDCDAGRARREPTGPLRLLFVGRMVGLKGICLALPALKESATDAVFTLIGDGGYVPYARKLAQRLGLADRVVFRGKLTRAETLRSYSDHDVLLFPSLHESGGFAVLEAMVNALPVICLDRGGPGLSVQPNCGFKISAGRRRRVIHDLAEAIRFYDRHRDLLRQHGERARALTLRDYAWDRKGELMNEIYQQLVPEVPTGRGRAA